MNVIERLDRLRHALDVLAHKLQSAERPGHVGYISKSEAGDCAATLSLDVARIIAEMTDDPEETAEEAEEGAPARQHGAQVLDEREALDAATGRYTVETGNGVTWVIDRQGARAARFEDCEDATANARWACYHFNAGDLDPERYAWIPYLEPEAVPPELPESFDPRPGAEEGGQSS